MNVEEVEVEGRWVHLCAHGKGQNGCKSVEAFMAQENHWKEKETLSTAPLENHKMIKGSFCGFMLISTQSFPSD